MALEILSERVEDSDAMEAATGFDVNNPPAGYFENPVPFFRALRDHDPLHRNADGSILLTRYQDVQTIWRDVSAVVGKQEYFGKRFGEGPLLEHFKRSIVYLDPPEHDALRTMLNPFFSAKALKGHAPNIERVVDELVANMAEKGDVDFVKEFASILPTRVICDLIGFPEADGDYIHGIAQRELAALNFNVPREQMPDAHRAAQEFHDYVEGILNELRASPNLDPEANMLSAMVAAERAGSRFDENDIIHSTMVIFNGGHGTTMHLLAASLHYMMLDGDSLALLRERPDAINVGFQELVRYVSPVQLHWRRTTKALELPSGVLPPDTEVMMCGASANRDEAAFDAPDEIRLARNPNKHIGFGSGIHFCLGAGLARMEVAAALPKILERFPRIERTGEVTFKPLIKFRALQSLPLSFG